ncbi:MAG: amino acid adenylation domain-containing protein [Deltaproteobacteria bacterium]|nr:amino acid adenylation domain-containing protein [Deltaproteobacteria bacterium]
MASQVSELLEKWRRVGVQLRAENGNIVVAGKKGALTAEIASEIKLNKAELLTFLGQADAAALDNAGQIEPAPRNRSLPLSSAQHRLWYIDLLVPGSSAYNIPLIVDLPGELDVPALATAINAVIARHESLRTTFALDTDGEPRQVIAPAITRALPLEDLSGLPVEERDAAADRWLQAWSREPFDLATGPLLRLGLVRLGPTSHVLAVVAHHIIYDGLSHEIFMRELAMYYRHAVTGNGPLPEPLPIQYADYAVWQRRAHADIHLAFWKDYLRGPLPVLDLPTIGPRPAVQTSTGAVVDFMLPNAIAEALAAEARKNGATFFMLILAAWKAALARFSGQDDLIVGTPIANRPRRETEAIIGFFANTLVVRTSLADDPTFTDVLDRVRKACLAAFSHQETPFDSLVKAVNPVRDTSRTPIYQTMFAMDDAAPVPSAAEPGALNIGGQRIGSTGSAQTDISLSSRRMGAGLRFAIDYNVDLYERALVEQLAGALRLILEHVAAGHNAKLSELPVLTPQARDELLRTLFPAPSPYPDKALHQWFEEQAAQKPQKVALRCGDETLTFAQLEERANQVAHQLQSLGVGPESRVAVAVPRSLNLVVALFGVLKAGGAYVPLDPGYPSDRLAHMLEDSQATVLVVADGTSGLLPDTSVTRLCLDNDAGAIAARPNTRPAVAFAPAQLAYVIYTSGSTGKPKGVMLEHRNTANLFVALAEQLQGGGVWFADTSVSFDISVLELFGALGHGFEVVLRKDRLAAGEDLPTLFARFGVTHFQCTPSQVSLLLADAAGCQALAQLKQLIVGGEALPPALLGGLREHLTGRLFNDYGPTETTVWSTAIELPHVMNPVPIGRPIANTRAYVLDAKGALLPRGVIGELWLAGAGVARGYHNRPDLNEERFVPDVFAHELGIAPPGRMYATGDKVRWRADGTLEYRGRGDAQVKIRGHRIELGEIENALRACAGVEEAAVIVREDSPGLPRIVAFVTTDKKHADNVTDLRGALKAHLPDVMIPEAIARVERMPKTPNGKVDRRALLNMDVPLARSGTPTERPRNAVEAALASAFASVLQLPAVGINQNFFELGGHSLLVVSLVRLLRDQNGIEMSLGALFAAPTVADLAKHVMAGDVSALDGSVVPLRRTGTNLPFFCICGIQLYQPLVNALGEGQPAFGVFVPAEVRVLTDAKAPKTLQVRKLAADYVRVIRRQQAHGPYCLGGISFGGVLAFEIAHQLVAAGEEVRVLALFDTVLPRGLTFAATSWLTGHLKRFAKESPWQRIEQRLRRSEISTAEKDEGFFGNVEELAELREKLYLKAMQDYDPTIKPFPGKGLLFRAQNQDAFIGYEIDKACGWGGLFERGLDVHTVPGDHIGIISEENVGALASTLRRQLDVASSNTPRYEPGQQK